MENVVLTNRERDIISILSKVIPTDVPLSHQFTKNGIRLVLVEAWKLPKEVLHDFGIGKFMVALLYFRLCGNRDFVFSWLNPPPKKGDLFLFDF